VRTLLPDPHLTLPDEKDRQSGEMVHFSPYDSKGGVHKGPLSTDNGFWDTFRTVYPLLGLAYRGELGPFLPSPPPSIALIPLSLVQVSSSRDG
jgi:hypothetical protein